MLQFKCEKINMPDQKQSYSHSEIDIDVNVTSFMMTVATFFTGFLISSYDSFDKSVRMPVLFLIVSTLSFLFSNIIFANASGEIRAGNTDKANKHAAAGNIISEFLGIYLLVISLPLAINAITGDIFLRISVFTISAVAIFAYSMSTFSIIKRYVFKTFQRLLYSLVFIVFWAICFSTQAGDSTAYVFSSAIIFIYLIFTCFFLMAKEKI